MIESVHRSEAVNWNRRTRNDTDFKLFLDITSNSFPFLIWNIPETSEDLKICKFIAKLWTTPQPKYTSLCKLCGCSFIDVFHHAICTCTALLLMRETFWDVITDKFGVLLNVELNALDTLDQYKVLLGKPLKCITDFDVWKTFLQLSFRYIYKSAAHYNKSLTLAES